MNENRQVITTMLILMLSSIFFVYLMINKKEKKIKSSLGESRAFVTPKVNIFRLSTEVDHGLNKVIIDDTTVLLIYRGTESVSMIKLK